MSEAPFVVGQLGQTLDGRIATRTGQSRDINCDAGLDYLHSLRAGVDAVVVGIGTVLADDPRLNVRRVPGGSPARVVIDPNHRLPAGARLLADDGVPVYVVSADGRANGTRAVPIGVMAKDGALPPAAIVAALGERGFRRLLIEGGAATLSRFIDAGAIDVLHLIVAPMILGSGRPGLTLAPIDTLDRALRPAVTVTRLDGAEIVFECRLKP